MKTASYGRGFNLIELMIVVVIIGILAAFAYPSYVEHTRKSRRSDAQTALLKAAASQEKYYADCTAYAELLTGLEADCDTKELGLGAANPESPEGYYRLTLEPGNIDAGCATYACGFKITADPVAGGPQDGDGALRIDGTGRREWNRNGAGTWVSWTAK